MSRNRINISIYLIIVIIIEGISRVSGIIYKFELVIGTMKISYNIEPSNPIIRQSLTSLHLNITMLIHDPDNGEIRQLILAAQNYMIVDYTMGAIAHNITTTLNGIPLQNEIFQNGENYVVLHEFPSDVYLKENDFIQIDVDSCLRMPITQIKSFDLGWIIKGNTNPQFRYSWISELVHNAYQAKSTLTVYPNYEFIHLLAEWYNVVTMYSTYNMRITLPEDFEFVYIKNNKSVSDIFLDYNKFNPLSVVKYIDSRNMIVEHFSAQLYAVQALFKFDLLSIKRKSTLSKGFTQGIQIAIFLYDVEYNEKITQSFEISNQEEIISDVEFYCGKSKIPVYKNKDSTKLLVCESFCSGNYFMEEEKCVEESHRQKLENTSVLLRKEFNNKLVNAHSIQYEQKEVIYNLKQDLNSLKYIVSNIKSSRSSEESLKATISELTEKINILYQNNIELKSEIKELTLDKFNLKSKFSAKKGIREFTQASNKKNYGIKKLNLEKRENLILINKNEKEKELLKENNLYLKHKLGEKTESWINLIISKSKTITNNKLSKQIIGELLNKNKLLYQIISKLFTFNYMNKINLNNYFLQNNKLNYNIKMTNEISHKMELKVIDCRMNNLNLKDQISHQKKILITANNSNKNSVEREIVIQDKPIQENEISIGERNKKEEKLLYYKIITIILSLLLVISLTIIIFLYCQLKRKRYPVVNNEKEIIITKLDEENENASRKATILSPQILSPKIYPERDIKNTRMEKYIIETNMNSIVGDLDTEIKH